MKTKLFIPAVLMLLSPTILFCQRPFIEFTFTAVNGTEHVTLDSILIKNITQNCDTMLYAPDTVLVLEYVTGFGNKLTMNNNIDITAYPNPFSINTNIHILIPEKDIVVIGVINLLGKEVLCYEKELDAGMHSYLLYPGNEDLYFITVSIQNSSKSMKLISAGCNSSNNCTLIYNGSDCANPETKSFPFIRGFEYNLGDELLFAGYSNGIQSGFIDATTSSQEYLIQFASDIPCPGIPTVNYGGQIYNTVQIFGQCWLKENLNIGTQINSGTAQTNNATFEKYCYNDSPSNCDQYGGLYQWREMMNYSTYPGIQGICPAGWHIPTDNEIKVLEGAVDSQYGIGHPVWDNGSWNGFDAGMHLKAAEGWNSNGNGTDTYGFRGIPAGRLYNGSFIKLGETNYIWSSNEYSPSSDYAWFHQLEYNTSTIYHYNYNKNMAFTVRCVKD